MPDVWSTLVGKKGFMVLGNENRLMAQQSLLVFDLVGTENRFASLRDVSQAGGAIGDLLERKPVI